MVTTTPQEPTVEAHDVPHRESDLPMASGSELRLNLKALGVDGTAPDFGKRLVQLTRDNEPYDFQFSAQGELIVTAPSRPLSNRDETVINADLEMYNRQNPGMCFSQTVAFRLPSNAQYMPDAAWITQERFDNLTEFELRNTINGAPDFVVEVRSRSDRLTPLLAKMAEWMEGGARLGWMLDSIDRRVYIFRSGREMEILDSPAVFEWRGRTAGFRV